MLTLMVINQLLPRPLHHLGNLGLGDYSISNVAVHHNVGPIE